MDRHADPIIDRLAARYPITADAIDRVRRTAHIPTVAKALHLWDDAADMADHMSEIIGSQRYVDAAARRAWGVLDAARDAIRYSTALTEV